MKQNKFFQVILLITGCVFALAFIINQVEAKTKGQTDDIKVLVDLKKEANYILHNEIIPHLQIKAFRNNQELTETNAAGEVLVKTVSYSGLPDFNDQDEVYIKFSGSEVTPQTPVMINIKSATKGTAKAIVNEEGIWTVNIPVSILAAGTNLAYIQTEKQGVKSDEVAIASFNVMTENRISTKTWYFIIFVTIAIIVLLFAIILQLRRNARDLEPGQLI